MLEWVNALDRSRIVSTWFLTLTVPAGEADWCLIERHRRAWERRLRREWGQTFFLIWKKEPHKSGWPHLHALLFWLQTPPQIEAFRSWNDDAWADVVRSKNPHHRRVGCKVERMRTWNGVAWYCSKYLSKTAEFEDQDTGRIWGIAQRDLMPVTREAVNVDRLAFTQISRVLRKLQQRRREKWLIRATGRDRWECVRSFYHREGHEFVAAERVVASAVRAGWRVKRVRPRCGVNRHVKIWAEGFAGRMVHVADEVQFTPCGLHLLDSQTIKRVTEFFGRAGHDPPS